MTLEIYFDTISPPLWWSIILYEKSNVLIISIDTYALACTLLFTGYFPRIKTLIIFNNLMIICITCIIIAKPNVCTTILKYKKKKNFGKELLGKETKI